MNIAAIVAFSLNAIPPHQVEAPTTRGYWYLTLMGGQTQKILGSSEIRINGGLDLGYGRFDPRLKLGTIPAEFVIEAYTYRTELQSAPAASPGQTSNYGALAVTRYRWPMEKAGNGMYVDLGFGVQFVNRPTFNLQSNLNTTPMVGIGGVFRSGKHEILLGLRLLHVSNGGRVKPNRGDNILFLTFTVRFSI